MNDEDLMARAVSRAAHARLLAPPNPWVGCVIVTEDGTTFEGATQRPGGPHAERVALERAGERASGATLYTTLEPCHHVGRTGRCTDAILAAGIRRVVIAVADPDPHVAGRGIHALLHGKVGVTIGVGHRQVSAQLRPYLHHRRTGRPYVVNKVATTLDGQTSAADGSSQWITNAHARADVHVLRAESDAILAGAGTIRSDNPRLTVRGITAADGLPPREPRRVVLGAAPDNAKVKPCTEYSGDLEALLDDLGAQGVVQMMIEGGPTTAHAFHSAGLVNQHVVYVGLSIMGGNDGTPVMNGPGAPEIGQITRGRLAGHRIFAGTLDDPSETIRIDVIPERSGREKVTEGK